MNDELRKVFDALAKLPDADQRAFAAIIQTELESEEHWRTSFANSQDQLKRLADEARAEHRAGLTEPLDPDAL